MTNEMLPEIVWVGHSAFIDKYRQGIAVAKTNPPCDLPGTFYKYVPAHLLEEKEAECKRLQFIVSNMKPF